MSTWVALGVRDTGARRDRLQTLLVAGVVQRSAGFASR
jgi:hypothetical protein